MAKNAKDMSNKIKAHSGNPEVETFRAIVRVEAQLKQIQETLTNLQADSEKKLEESRRQHEQEKAKLIQEMEERENAHQAYVAKMEHQFTHFIDTMNKKMNTVIENNEKNIAMIKDATLKSIEDQRLQAQFADRLAVVSMLLATSIGGAYGASIRMATSTKAAFVATLGSAVTTMALTAGRTGYKLFDYIRQGNCRNNAVNKYTVEEPVLPIAKDPDQKSSTELKSITESKRTKEDVGIQEQEKREKSVYLPGNEESTGVKAMMVSAKGQDAANAKLSTPPKSVSIEEEHKSNSSKSSESLSSLRTK